MTYDFRKPVGSLSCGGRCVALWLTEATSGQGVGETPSQRMGSTAARARGACGCRWAALLTVKILTG